MSCSTASLELWGFYYLLMGVRQTPGPSGVGDPKSELVVFHSADLKESVIRVTKRQ